MKTTRKMIILAVAAVGLVGCATPPTNMEGYRAVGEETGLPVLKAAAFEGHMPRRAMFADMEVREDYARYDANGAKAELFYVNPRDGFSHRVALDHSHDSSNVAELFNYSNSRTVETRPGKRVETDFATVWYRILNLPEDNRQCAIFNTEWDLHPGDSLLRPDKVLFGYYCRPPGAPLDDAAAVEIVGGVGVRDVNIPLSGQSLEIGGPAPADAQSQLAELARGDKAAGEWGAATFPFDMAVSYPPSNDKEWP